MFVVSIRKGNIIYMRNADRKQLKKKLKNQEQAIRVILNRWDPVLGSPENEYDCLVHKVLGMLRRDASKDELISMIRSELVNHFGLHESKEQIKLVVEKILTFWARS